jgi:hypothetical protein
MHTRHHNSASLQQFQWHFNNMTSATKIHAQPSWTKIQRTKCDDLHGPHVLAPGDVPCLTESRHLARKKTCDTRRFSQQPCSCSEDCVVHTHHVKPQQISSKSHTSCVRYSTGTCQAGPALQPQNLLVFWRSWIRNSDRTPAILSEIHLFAVFLNPTREYLYLTTTMSS